MLSSLASVRHHRSSERESFATKNFDDEIFADNQLTVKILKFTSIKNMYIANTVTPPLDH